MLTFDDCVDTCILTKSFFLQSQTAAPIGILEEKSVLFGPNLVAQDVGSQYGGEIVNYEEGLAFVTFHGSGHMVPQVMSLS